MKFYSALLSWRYFWRFDWYNNTWRHQFAAACLRGFDMTRCETQPVCFARSRSDHVRYAFHRKITCPLDNVLVSWNTVIRERRPNENYFKLCERFPSRNQGSGIVLESKRPLPIIDVPDSFVFLHSTSPFAMLPQYLLDKNAWNGAWNVLLGIISLAMPMSSKERLTHVNIKLDSDHSKT